MRRFETFITIPSTLLALALAGCSGGGGDSGDSGTGTETAGSTGAGTASTTSTTSTSGTTTTAGSGTTTTGTGTTGATTMGSGTTGGTTASSGTTGGTTAGSGTTGGTTAGSGTTGGATAGSGTTGGTTGGVNPDCGNGNLDPGEECDDGNLDPTDTCTADCKVSDLLLWYDFEGDAANEGNEPGYDGTVDAAATYVAGKQGMALQCASETANVLVPNLRDLLLAHPNLTIGLWFKEDSVVPNTTLFSFRGPTPLRNGLDAYHGANNSAVLFTCADGTNDFAGCKFFPYTEGPWHHVAWRYAATGTNAGEGADVEIYFDGELVATIDNPTKASILTPDILLDGILCNGRGDTPPQPNFQIDDFKIWGATYDVATQCEVVVGGTWENNACTLP